jgi:hypothetical protein
MGNDEIDCTIKSRYVFPSGRRPYGLEAAPCSMRLSPATRTNRIDLIHKL